MKLRFGLSISDLVRDEASEVLRELEASVNFSVEYERQGALSVGQWRLAQREPEGGNVELIDTTASISHVMQERLTRNLCVKQKDEENWDRKA